MVRSGRVPPQTRASAAPADHTAVVQRYCIGCHNEKRLSGGLSLASFDVAHAADQAEVTERIIRKLQAGMMPPPGASRPDPDTYAALITALESRVMPRRRPIPTRAGARSSA